MIDPKLAKLVAQTLKISQDQVTPQLESGAIPAWDSLGHLQLFMQLERQFGIKFKTDEIMNKRTIQEIQDALSQRGVL